MKGAGDVVAVDEDLRDRHACPAAGVRETAGMPGPACTQVAEQPGEHMRGGDDIVEQLRWRRGPLGMQNGKPAICPPGDVPRVVQQRIGDVLDGPAGGPARRDGKI